MDYTEALEYIHGVSWLGSKLGLSRTRELLAKLGNPQDNIKFIHVAGTNGKGSVCSMLASVLAEAGFKTGLYTSPYILRFNERMQINGCPISDSELAEITEYVKPFAESMQDHPTEFELVTAIGFEYFKRHDCDFVVLEVGMGGELDSTNVIKNPVLAIITEIGLDHVRELGGSLEKIAQAKAGIIKDGCTVLSYNTQPASAAVIENVCIERGAQLISPDFSKVSDVVATGEGIRFRYNEYCNLEVAFNADYQSKNASAVVEAVKALRTQGVEISDEALRAGLKKVRWPARFEKLCDNPTIVFDGGHNPNGVEAAVESFKFRYPSVKPVVMIGIMADKNYGEVLDLLVPLAESFVAVRPQNPRALDSETLCAEIVARGGKCVSAGSVEAGLSRAIDAAGENGFVFALGSLYMYGEVVQAMKRPASNNKA